MSAYVAGLEDQRALRLVGFESTHLCQESGLAITLAFNRVLKRRSLEIEVLHLSVHIPSLASEHI